MGKVIKFCNKGEKKMNKGVLDANLIARAFLYMQSMTNKKLQKLCYYSQAWHLAFYKEGLFYQNIEAWVHGPVIPEIYRNYKEYRWSNIPKEKTMPREIDDTVYEFLQQIFNTYGKFDGDELELLTHSEEPWKRARENYEEWQPSHVKLDDELMANYYWKIYEPNED